MSAACPLHPDNQTLIVGFRTSASGQKATFVISLDHLVGQSEHVGGDCETEHLCRFQIDHQIKFGRLLDRQISGFSPSVPMIGHL
jgi:hypothetical protein